MSYWMKRSLTVLILLSTPLIAAAQEQEYCLDRASEAAYEECLQMRFDHADGALNLLYQQALSVIEDLEGASQEEVRPEEWRTALREAQRAWVAFKEAECEKLAPREHWMMWNEEHAKMICRIRLTEARVRDLAAHYNLSANPTAGAYSEIIQAKGVDGLDRRTLERFGQAVERHDWEEVRSMFNEESYLDQRDGFGLEDAQIILETLGIEGNLRSGDEDEENVYAARLNRIAEIVITKAAYDDSQTLTVEGFIMLYDGSEHRFRMHWAERMNGGLEVVVPVG